MHATTCPCPNCCSRRDALMPVQRFAFRAAGSPPLSEEQEIDLALELLGVSNDQEWEQFLGKLVRGIGRGIRKVGSIAGKIVKPLGGALKGLAKKALPFVGGALGSLIPIPGVGTALGTALGSAVSGALEMEFQELEQDEAEFEMARRFVRIAADATRQSMARAAQGDPQAVVRDALLSAVRAHVPRLDETELEAGPVFGEAESDEMEQETHYFGPSAAESQPAAGRWRRRGRRIVLSL